MMMYFYELMSSIYLTYSDIISRIPTLSHSSIKPHSLSLITPGQALLVKHGVASDIALRRSAIVRLPPGVAVKRGISVYPPDPVSVSDIQKVLTYSTDVGQNFMIPMKDLVDSDDTYDPCS